jgi:hypothetical protein
MERSIVAVMARLGATDPYSAALAVMAYSEGIILHRIARHDAADPPPYVPVVRRRTTPETQYSGICLDQSVFFGVGLIPMGVTIVVLIWT